MTTGLAGYYAIYGFGQYALIVGCHIMRTAGVKSRSRTRLKQSPRSEIYFDAEVSSEILECHADIYH